MFRSLFNLCDSFSFDTFLSEGDKGGASDTNKPDDKKDDDKPDDDKKKDGEETITLTKRELDERLNNKFAEGARKAQQGKLDNNSNETQKTSTGENKGENKSNNDDKVQVIADELAQLKAEKVATKLGVNPAYTEDLVALCRGKSLELDEENLKKEFEKHPEWKLVSTEGAGGVKALGSSDGKAKTPEEDEKAKARSMFGL